MNINDITRLLILKRPSVNSMLLLHYVVFYSRRCLKMKCCVFVFYIVAGSLIYNIHRVLSDHIQFVSLIIEAVFASEMKRSTKQ